MISVNVKLFGPLYEYHPEKDKGDTSKAFVHKVQKGMTVEKLLYELEIPCDYVKIIFVNSKKASFGTVLSENDEVRIFPPIAGG